ncbi:hypothetical protein HA402_000479 [Bradysia odoriphaga]|nr:hypothetical protein HA402_000479 [Bradysia odoriphaga]
MDLDDFDDELTEDDLKFLEAEELKSGENSLDVSMRVQPITENAETIETVDDADFAHFFEEDGEPDLEDLECLKSKFRHQCFRAKQWDIIKSLREGRDVCAVMATGYGKSLCYQFTAVRSKKITLVVSPLIALMQAQVLDLTKIGISACLVGSAQKDTKILEKISMGNFTIIYSSPEYLQTWNGDKLLSIIKNKLAMVAIDEAHCVSQWGHDFRPDFRKLNVLRHKLPNTPILAVTATATENVRYDIITLLGLNEPRVIMTSFDRTNLEFIVKRKTTDMCDLLPLIKDINGSVIVYVLKRKEAEETAKRLKDNGIICDHYHAGLSIPQRTEVLEKFLNDALKVIVATISFGMGIDKRDIRNVIHYGSSKNLESYYQEVGRAGRDGKPAKVITFFSPDDFEVHDWFLEVKSKKREVSAVIMNYLRSLGAKMRDFLYSTQCRRKTILEYFGENTSLTPRPNCCDNCTIGLGSWRLTDLYEDIDDNGIYDFSIESKILLEAIKCLTVNGISTEKRLVKKFLIGKYDQRLQQVQRNRCYGSGRSHSEQYWLALIEQLSQNEYIDIAPNGKNLALTSTAENWLQNAVGLRLKAIGQMFEYFDRKASTPLVVGLNRTNRYNVTSAVTDLLRKDYVLCDELLKQVLSEVRDAIFVLPTNVLDKNDIASMSDLDKMVKAKPRNLDEFRYALKGSFSEKKVNKFGPTFVNAVSRFTSAQLEMQNILLNHPMPDVNMDHVVSPQILHLLKERKTKEEILQLTNLTERQLFDDIVTLIQTGQPVLQTDIAYMSHIDFKVFSRLIPNTTIDITTVERIDEMTTKYFQSTSEHADSGYVRLGLTYYAVRFHLNRLCVPYVDCERNVLVNAEKLIAKERLETLNTTFSTDRHYAPYYRSNPYNGHSFIEFLFGDCLGDHISYDAYEYDENAYAEFNGYEHYDSDNIIDSDRDEADSEQERDEASEEEDNEASEEEDNEASEEEANESSEEERNETSEEDSDQESFVVSDSESVTDDEGGTDSEENSSDLSDTDDDTDSDDDSDSDFDYESERRNYGRKRRRIS